MGPRAEIANIEARADYSRAPGDLLLPRPALTPWSIFAGTVLVGLMNTASFAQMPAETARAPVFADSAPPFAATISEQSRQPAQPLPWLISDEPLDRERLAELAGTGSRTRLLLRSVSTLLSDRDAGAPRLTILGPEMQLVYNSALPWSVNDGAMWAGRGSNMRMIGGFALSRGNVRAVFAPELVTSANQHFDLHAPWIERPDIPPDRSSFQFEWYANGPYSIDMPTRFGTAGIRRLHLGQSSLAAALGPLEIGVATENSWWGPGIANALILSNNAPGFPHVFFRSARPLNTRLGAIDFRWLVGGLSESDFFDTTTANDLRSITAAALTLTPRRPHGLTLGLARSVWGTASGWNEIPARWFEVFHSTGNPNRLPLSDSALYPGGRDQLYSLFARWVFVPAGIETYIEWGRSELPSRLREFVVSPRHSEAYTIGLQWSRAISEAVGTFRLYAENTSVEQSETFRDRPMGVWYTSRRVIQGYTNRGQPLGAAVGPGSSGQILGFDLFRGSSSFGLKAGRIRYNEDVRAISPIFWFKAWCTHDIYLYWGPRASVQSRIGRAAIDLTLANRIQPWFQVGSGCPRGDTMIDIRNNTLRLTLSR